MDINIGAFSFSPNQSFFQLQYFSNFIVLGECSNLIAVYKNQEPYTVSQPACKNLEPYQTYECSTSVCPRGRHQVSWILSIWSCILDFDTKRVFSRNTSTGARLMNVVLVYARVADPKSVGSFLSGRVYWTLTLKEFFPGTHQRFKQWNFFLFRCSFGLEI